MAKETVKKSAVPLNDDELEKLSGGYMDFTAGDCPAGGQHEWIEIGVTRQATQCGDRLAETHPDKEIRCSKCRKIGWKVFTRDYRWVYTYDD